MFFMIGMTQGKQDFNFHQTIICNHCGSYGRYQVFMTYMCLSLFFIPVFKWDKKYYVQTTCCNTIYALDPEVGRRIARGEQVEIQQRDLTPVQAGYRSQMKRCRNCGYETQEDFGFCPKCGQRF